MAEGGGAIRHGLAEGGSLGLRRILGTAFLVTLVTTLPPFLAGSLASEVSSSLDSQPTFLGLAIGGFFFTAGFGSIVIGKTVEARGWRVSMQLASTLSGTSLLGVGLLGQTRFGFALCLAFGGLSMSVGNPGVNLALATEAPTQRQGLVFGVKHSAVPVSAFLSGLALPVFALNFGWRAVFVGAGVMALSSALLPAKIRERSPKSPRDDGARSGELRLKPLVALACGALFAAIGASALSAFLVISLIDSGVSIAIAGILLSFASVGGLMMRLLAGWLVDRQSGTGLGGVAGLLALGALGCLLLTASSLWVLTIGAFVTFAAGWGWNGLFNFAVVKSHPNAPGRATSLALVGTYWGAATGPVLFGLVADSMSFDVAWLVTAGVALVGSGVMLVARSMVD